MSYAIIGGIAAIARGIPRHTNDVDVTIQGGGPSERELLARLQSAGLEARIPEALAEAMDLPGRAAELEALRRSVNAR